MEIFNRLFGSITCYGNKRLLEKGCYYLPEEKEWDIASKGGAKTRYFFGEDSSDLENYAWFNMNSGGKTHSVGQKRANPFGLYDIYGNVWEMMYETEVFYYPTRGTVGTTVHAGMIRGTSWNHKEDYIFVKSSRPYIVEDERYSYAPSGWQGVFRRFSSHGFRLTRKL